MKLVSCLLILSVTLCACVSSRHDSLPTVTNFKPEQYAGQWHEVARLPNFFERGVVAAKATYKVMPRGEISVFNEGLKASGERTSIRGAAKIVGDTPDSEAKLEVRFHKFPASLFAGDYWILDLNDAHTLAIVGSPNKKYLWLLAKNPQATPANFTAGIKRMQKYGFAMNELIVNLKRVD